MPIKSNARVFVNVISMVKAVIAKKDSLISSYDEFMRKVAVMEDRWEEYYFLKHFAERLGEIMFVLSECDKGFRFTFANYEKIQPGRIRIYRNIVVGAVVPERISSFEELYRFTQLVIGLLDAIGKNVGVLAVSLAARSKYKGWTEIDVETWALMDLLTGRLEDLLIFEVIDMYRFVQEERERRAERKAVISEEEKIFREMFPELV